MLGKTIQDSIRKRNNKKARLGNLAFCEGKVIL